MNINVNKLFSLVDFNELWLQMAEENPDRYSYKTKNLYEQLYKLFTEIEPDNSYGEKEVQVLHNADPSKPHIVLCSLNDEWDYIEAVFLPWRIVANGLISDSTIREYGRVELCKIIFENAIGFAFFENDEFAAMQSKNDIDCIPELLEDWKSKENCRKLCALIGNYDENYDEEDYFELQDNDETRIDIVSEKLHFDADNVEEYYQQLCDEYNDSDECPDNQSATVHKANIVFEYMLDEENFASSESDIQVFFDDNSSEYAVELPTIEKILADKGYAVWALKKLLREFSKWMRDNKFDTHVESNFGSAFLQETNGLKWLPTIEDAYAYFRDQIKGFVLLSESENRKSRKKKR